MAGVLVVLILLVAMMFRSPDTRTADGRPDASRLYSVHCVGCHGEDGRRAQGAGDLSNASKRAEDELRTVIANGRKAMPAWKQPRGPLSDAEVDALAIYVQRFSSAP